MLDPRLRRSCIFQGQSPDPIVQRSMTIGTVLIFFIVIVVIIISVKPLVMSYAYEIGGVVRQTRPLIFSGLGIRAQWPRASSWEVRRNARIERCGAGKRGASIVISCD